ncbi:MAG: ABC transporter [Candidatus Glassbacteria bacterium RIFCSPLOWO2_12_FULL_58_11]|uniref:ABC transporter n=2 Tax=Candidatus Glassiibacteriota TaxID=1817805 RepID=A0A1F5YJU9_9BACT|nr:MAG: ABC transporter [Candidatus Glassbacteria bacterium RIFCSPLOWO2_12_FULL_58_11]
MIKIENLTKYYDATLAVDSVSFEVQKGEVVGFLGPNGAGKTTTMRIITCYLKPTSGKVTIEDFDIFEQPIEVRKRIGYLPENCPLYPEMNVLDYLNYIAELRQIPRAERSKRVREMIGVTSIGDVLHKDIGELSKGYRQRVGLAQAMVHDPEILILDEPTSGLDPNQIIEIRQLIRDIGREKTIILSTHILPEVSATCNRVLIINDARLIASGTPDELVSRAQGAEVITAGIKGPEEAVFEALRQADFIAEFRKVREELAGEQSWLTLEIQGQGDQTSEKLFHLAVRQGWTLRELRLERLSLEEVFARLTTA